MRDKLAKELRAAKPKLKLVSPVSFWFIALMGVFNLILGASFIFALESAELDKTLDIVAAVVPIWAWAALFTGLGFVKLYSIIVNSWTLSRYSLLVGVALKSGWAFALAARTLEIPDNIFLTLTWVTVALVQVLCYIHFLPPAEPRKLDGGLVNEQ